MFEITLFVTGEETRVWEVRDYQIIAGFLHFQDVGYDKIISGTIIIRKIIDVRQR